MDWRLLVAPLGLAIGFGLGWRAIKRGRRQADCSGALLHWTERPASAWRENWAGALFITLHEASIDQALALLRQYLPQTPPEDPVPWPLRWPVFLSLGLALVVPYVACAVWLYVNAFPWGRMYNTFVYLLGLGLLRVYQR